MLAKQLSFYRTKDDDEDDVYSLKSMSHCDEEEENISEDYDCSSSVRTDVVALRGLNIKQKAAEEERSTLGKQESEAIEWLYWTVVFVWFMVGISFGSMVYGSIREGQEIVFREQFAYNAQQVTDKFQSQLRQTLDAADNLSVDITSYALATGSKFPFVTLPDFELKGANARITGDTLMIYYFPYVKDALKGRWETYAATNREQYD